jgi:hypothetical protein
MYVKRGSPNGQINAYLSLFTLAHVGGFCFSLDSLQHDNTSTETKLCMHANGGSGGNQQHDVVRDENAERAFIVNFDVDYVFPDLFQRRCAVLGTHTGT